MAKDGIMETSSILNNIKAKPEVLQVVFYPDPILSTVSTSVLESIPHNEPLQALMDSMIATMQAYRAVGLAAIQVGVPLRVLVVQDEHEQPIKVINPRIVEVDTEMLYTREACLSLPGLFVSVNRPKSVTIEYFNELGELKTTYADDLLGRAIQHEMDHLDGLTFLDRLNKIYKSAALKKYKLIKRKLKFQSALRTLKATL